MFLYVEQFADIWRVESAATLRFIGRLNEEALKVRVAPEARSAGETAWHIVAAIGDIGGLMGLPLSGPRRGDPPPGRVAEMSEAYDRAAHELLNAIMSQWSDETLRRVDDIYGEQWPRGHTLYVLLAHEIHHRGQLSTLLRAAGLTIPAVYGPSRDEQDRPPRPR